MSLQHGKHSSWELGSFGWPKDLHSKELQFRHLKSGSWHIDQFRACFSRTMIRIVGGSWEPSHRLIQFAHCQFKTCFGTPKLFSMRSWNSSAARKDPLPGVRFAKVEFQRLPLLFHQVRSWRYQNLTSQLWLALAINTVVTQLNGPNKPKWAVAFHREVVVLMQVWLSASVD